MSDMEELRDAAKLGTAEETKPRKGADAAEKIAPFDDHAAYDETAARVGNTRNIGVGDDPGAEAFGDTRGEFHGDDPTGDLGARRPYIKDRDEIAPS